MQRCTVRSDDNVRCVADALVTVATPGDEVRGYCTKHLHLIHAPVTQSANDLTNQILSAIVTATAQAKEVAA